MTIERIGTGRRVGMLAVLGRRDFALLWAAGLISNLGSWASFVAIPVFVFDQTRSALAATAVFTITVVPMVFTSVAGVFVDRWDRRRILIVTNLLQAAVTAPLVLIPHGHLWVVYAAMFGLAFIGNFGAPAENSLLPTLAGKDQLPSANGLTALNDNIGRIAGPALGAAILALGGFTTVIMVDVASFVVAAALVTAIRTRSIHRGPAGAQMSSAPTPRPRLVRQRLVSRTSIASAIRTAVAEGAAGWWTVRGSSVLAPVLQAMSIVTVGDAIFSALLGPYFGGPLAATGATLGVWLSLRGVGGLFGSVPASRLSRTVRPHHLVIASLAGSAALLALMALLPTPLVVMPAAVGLGILVTGWITDQQLLIQRATPGAYLGRVFGIQRTVSAIGMIIGSITAGAAAGVLGVSNMLYLAAGGYLGAALWLLTHYRPTTPPPSSRLKPS